MTSKERVLEVYPYAHCYPQDYGAQRRFIVADTQNWDCKRIGISTNEEAAWQNAAESLPAEPEKEEVSKQDDEDGPPCQHCNHPFLSHDDEWGACQHLGLTDTLHEICKCPGYEESEEGPECGGGEPCWRNPETGYIEYCPKHEAIIADKAMASDVARKDDLVAPVEAKEKGIQRLKEALQRSIEQRESLCAQLEESEKLLENALKNSEPVAEPKPTPSTHVPIEAFCPKCRISITNTTAGVRECPVCHGPIEKPHPDSSSISTEQTFEEWWDLHKYTVYSEPKGAHRATWNAAKGQS